MVQFPDYLKTTGPVEPTSLYNNPYTHAHNMTDMGKTTWEIMAMDREKCAVFQAGLGAMDNMCPVLGYYDFDQLATTEDISEIVDVGGGQGQSLVAILNTHKKIDPAKCVLQDMAAILSMATAAKMLPKEVRKMETDFFVEQPVKGKVLPATQQVPRLSPQLARLTQLLIFPIHRCRGILHPPRPARLERRRRDPDLETHRPGHGPEIQASDCRFLDPRRIKRGGSGGRGHGYEHVAVCGEGAHGRWLQDDS